MLHTATKSDLELLQPCAPSIWISIIICFPPDEPIRSRVKRSQEQYCAAFSYSLVGGARLQGSIESIPYVWYLEAWAAWPHGTWSDPSIDAEVNLPVDVYLFNFFMFCQKLNFTSGSWPSMHCIVYSMATTYLVRTSNCWAPHHGYYASSVHECGRCTMFSEIPRLCVQNRVLVPLVKFPKC